MVWVFIAILVVPGLLYIGTILFFSLPERLYPRTYPVKSICSKPSCARCSTNQALLDRAKFFYDDVYNSNDRLKQSLEASSNESEPLIFRLSGLLARPLWRSIEYGPQISTDIALLQENFPTIKLTALNLLNRHQNKWLRNSEPGGSNWFVFPLLNQGTWNDANLRYCPEVMAILFDLKSIMDKCVFGNIFFSILPPKTKIATHRGPTNIRLRCHFCLETARVKKECTLTVGDEGGEEKVHWTEREAFVFDDSFPHSVESTTKNEERIALILDLWHPGISENERYRLQRMFPDVPDPLA
uniref:Asp_Arg_Hydrox domain-containing protein n=1 Tax=Panagrellus redivivus TaxID=6233 RepID=A0A7E4VDX4_PANRE